VSAIGTVVLAGVLLASAAGAWWLRTHDGALRSGPEAGEDPGARSVLRVLERLGARPSEADLTIVQFSTAFCGPCRATRARLEHLQRTHPGLAVLHVDAEQQLDAVRELDVRRTPTLFYLDRAGTLVGRSSGAPRPDALAAVVGGHTGTAPGGSR